MDLEEFEKASETELRQKANEYFSKLNTGPLDWPAHLLAAKFYTDEIERRAHAKDRKYDIWVSRRDLFLEIVVIVLIGAELYFGWKGGNDQLTVLNNMQTSTNKTVETLTAVHDSLETQRKTLKAELDTAELQQKLISKQLKIQESVYAEQQRSPESEVMAQYYDQSGYSVKKLDRTMRSLVRYVGTPIDQTVTEVNLYFFVRDIGTAPIRNLSILRRFSASIRTLCVDYPSVVPIGDTPGACSDSLGRIPAIYPAPKEAPLPTNGGNINSPDFMFRVKILVPRGVERFDMNLILVADNLAPTLFRAQFLHYVAKN